LFILLLFTSCKNNPSASSPEKNILTLTSLEKKVVASDNSFGIKLFVKVNSAELRKNVFISPLSVSMALGMTLNGANGATLDSMKATLEHSDFTMQEINDSYKNISSSLMNLDPTVQFQIANSIWYERQAVVLDPFKASCQNYFNADITSLDFSLPTSVDVINSWVNSKTNGKIPTILDQIPDGMIMYLINAIYFKGTWTYQFKTENTADADFTTASGTTISCKMMSQRATYAYRSTETAQVIDLPYGDKSFSMTIILPKEGIPIDEFSSIIDQNYWDMLISSLDSTEVNLFLPKFKLEYMKTLNDELSAMGMGIAFTDGADFSRIAQLPLCISEVKHKTFVEVDEEGTEAAAVTSVGVWTTSTGGDTAPVMFINHPFIFAIREHQSGTILFIGKIVEPKL
jgi:serine protease inhibitor